jgi:hypothetical protein
VTVDRVDRGLLMTVLELLGDGDSPPTSAAVSEAVGIPEEYVDIVEERLEQNRERGFLRCDRNGCWRLTPNGVDAVGRGIPRRDGPRSLG